MASAKGRKRGHANDSSGKHAHNNGYLGLALVEKHGHCSLFIISQTFLWTSLFSSECEAYQLGKHNHASIEGLDLLKV